MSVKTSQIADNQRARRLALLRVQRRTKAVRQHVRLGSPRSRVFAHYQIECFFRREDQLVGRFDHPRFQSRVDELREKLIAAKWIVCPRITEVRNPRHTQARLKAQANKVIRHRLTECCYQLGLKFFSLKPRQCRLFRQRNPIPIFVRNTAPKRDKATRQRGRETRKEWTKGNILTECETLI